MEPLVEKGNGKITDCLKIRGVFFGIDFADGGGRAHSHTVGGRREK
jgi:hypothetical protein